MKNKWIPFAASLLFLMTVMLGANAKSQSQENRTPLTERTFRAARTNVLPAPPRLPDLMIHQFELVDPQVGQVKVVVINRGRNNAVPCILRLIVWEPGKFEQKEAKTVFVNVPELHSGKTATVIAIAGVPIINTKYSLFVDINHDVAEGDEKNNRAEGEAGNYKP